MNCIVYTNNDEFSGSKELSGTTCQGVSGFFYLNYGDSICMDIDRPIILCDYFSIGGMCPTPSVTPSNTPTISLTPSVTTTRTPTQTMTPSPTPPVCQRIYIEFTGSSSGLTQYYTYSPQSPAYIATGGTPEFFYIECSPFSGNSYAFFTGETTGHSVIYYPNNAGGGAYVTYGLTAGARNDCGEGSGALSIDAVFNTGFTYNGFVYPAEGPSRNSGLATLTYVNCPPIITPSATPTLTQTQTPSSTIGSTPTQTPSQTLTSTPTPSLTPTTTPTLTVCPNTNNCMEITVTGATEEFFPSIEYNNCYGTLIGEAFTTNGTRYRCIQFTMGVAQIFSYTGMPEPTIFGGNCNTFDCPTDVVPLTSTPTPTVTQTQTPSVTPTTTPTLTVCPNTNNCMAITVTGATEEFFPSIEYNNCFGTLIAEAFTTNGTRYRCIQFTMGVAQIFSYTGMEEPTIFGGNCNTFECPTSVVPLTPTPTPTVTQTQTPSSTIGATPTQTQTQTQTQTNTPTPSVTLTATTAGIDISNSSLDISISDVTVNAVNTTVIGGSLPNTTGNGTNLSTTQLGVQDVVVFYSAGVAGQNITLIDSDSVSTCQNTNTGSNSLTFTGVKVAAYQNLIIDATDGTCS